MMRFTLPRDIYYGKDSLEVLKTVKGKKAILVIGGGSMKRAGFVDKIIGYLKEAGIETKLFEGVEPDPSVETVMKGAAAMREFEPDLIVALGGGSPIDAAKAMWVFYEYPDTTFEEAARLAAYYSSMRGSDKVEIDYVEKKQVKKPGGGKPGFVVYYTNYSMVIDSNISQIRLCAD